MAPVETQEQTRTSPELDRDRVDFSSKVEQTRHLLNRLTDMDRKIRAGQSRRG